MLWWAGENGIPRLGSGTLALVLVAACAGEITSTPPGADAAASTPDATVAPPDAAAAQPPECEWGGAPGSCLSSTACGAMAGHTLEPGTVCSAPLGCCIVTPSVASNPPTPTGYKLMMQSSVTPAMTDWAIAILHDHVTYPMFATTKRTFGALEVLARVEWHPPDFQNGIIHRGVTLYEPR